MQNLPEDTAPVRNGEDFDHRSVERYLREKIRDLPRNQLDVSQFSTGVSNLTYLLRMGEWEAVLRRPPAGPVPFRAHDMVREYQLLRRLNPEFELAPRPYLLCEDNSIMGAPFYVMERRHGIIFNDCIPHGSRLDEEIAKRLSELTIRGLVKLHSVDWRRGGLAELGHPEGFLARQVKGWSRRYELAKTDEIPEMEKLFSWVNQNIPESPPASVIHNDYKLNNMMFDYNLEKVVAVLDWEMSTIGDPLLDLAVALSYWLEPSDPDDLRAVLPNITSRASFCTRNEFIRLYTSLSGREPKNLDFYLVFAYFKLAVILQQLSARWARNQTTDSRFARFDENVRVIARYAATLLK